MYMREGIEAAIWSSVLAIALFIAMTPVIAWWLQ